MKKSGKSIEEIRKEITSERKDRDSYYFVATRRKTLSLFASDIREWITQETKEQLRFIEATREKDTLFSSYATQIESRVKEIQKRYIKKIIFPMEKLSKGEVEAATESELCQKMMQSIESAYSIVLELLEYRTKLDALYLVNSKSKKTDEKIIIEPTKPPPDGMYT